MEDMHKSFVMRASIFDALSTTNLCIAATALHVVNGCHIHSCGSQGSVCSMPGTAGKAMS